MIDTENTQAPTEVVQETPVEESSKTTAQKLFEGADTDTREAKPFLPEKKEEPKAEVTPTEVKPEVTPVEPKPVATPQEVTPVQQEVPKNPQIDLAQQQEQLRQQQEAFQRQQLAAQQPQQQTPQQSPQKLPFDVYKVSQADYDSIFEVDTKEESIANLDKVLQNVVRQSLQMSNVLVENAKQELSRQVQPYMQFADSHREEALRQNFYAQHKDLQGQDQIVGLVITQLKQEGKNFNSEKEVFEEVAKRTKATLANFSQGGQVTPQQQNPAQGTQTPQGKPPMATLTTGGQSGSTGSSQASASNKGNTAKKIFGPN